MMAFLQQQRHTADGQSRAADAEKQGAQNHTANGDKQQEYLTVAARGKNARKSTVLLAVLFGIGLLCLWFMIKESVPQTAAAEAVSSEETRIETAITRLTGIRAEMFSRMDEIVKRFYEFSDVQQVKVGELVKNPFETESFVGNLRQQGSEETDSDIEAEWLRQQAQNMQLFSIMRSQNGNCCMINDKILYVGDSIRGMKVRQIDDKFVRLELEGAEVGPERDKEGLGARIILKLTE